QAPRTASAAGAGDVFLSGDGLHLSPAEHAALLARLAAGREIAADDYALGGEVAEFEAWFARLLGKERAVFMPTGTLANHLALRTLARGRSRVIVQDVSHVYNDTGDGCQVLSNLNLIPLAPGKGTFTREDVERVLARTASGRVAAQVGAISIESPIRRLRGELFDYGEMKRLSAFARERGIGLHLDGARLFMASAFSGVQPAEYASLFDTVYLSLWKCFNAMNGAVLAGPAAVIDGLFHVRRMFGGALWNAWAFAAVARHYAEGFLERYGRAVRVSEDFARALQGPLRVERIPGGSHLFYVRAPGADLARARQRLAADGIHAPEPTVQANEPALLLGVNESWTRTTGAALAEAFQRALG
ncbi:MAG: beta-eliminating lyase-related protein, partial [Vicinamibacterales bacterium]|nr:beta-eliminating lyase-related protein [Vicinamibacterales bacterium]